MTQTNGHIGLTEAGVSFAGWPRSEVELFLKTVGKFVASQTQPLKREIEILKSQIEELQARKFSGVHQRALHYRCGAQVTFDNALWTAITDAGPGEVPGQSLKWQLCFRQIQPPPRSPTKHGDLRPQQPVERRT